MGKQFDFKAARQAGYSDSEISSYLGETNPHFDVQGAIQAGYSPEEVNVHLSELRQPSRTKSLLSAGAKGLRRGGAALNPLMPKGPIPEELANRVFDEVMPSQEKGAEQVIERAGELAPIVATGSGGAGIKALEIGGGALLGHLAEKEGLGKGGQTAAEIIGLSFPGLIKSLGIKALSFAKKGLTKTTGEAAAKLSKIKPEQVKEVVRGAAERLGVLEDLPLSAQVDNPIIQGTETKLMQSMSGSPIQQKIERMGTKLEDVYKEAGKTLSQRENMLPSVVSSEATNVLKSMEEASQNAYRSLYSQASKALPEAAATIPKVGLAIHKVIDSTLGKLKSALGTPSKDALFNRLNRLKDAWSVSPELRAGAIPIKELETLKQDLNQVIKYETKGGVDKLLTQLQGVVKEGIQSYGRQYNQPYLNRFNQAEKLFKENAQTFRKDPVLKVLVKGERPEQIFGKMGTVKGINDLEKVFNKTSEGRDVMDALKKYKLEDLLNKKVLDKNGNISWGKAAGMFKEPKTRDLVIKLVGPEQYKKLKDLSIVASGVEEGFKKFLNTSKTATAAADMMLLGALPVKAATQLFSGNILGAIKTTGYILAPHQLAKLIANPKFVEAAIEAAKAGKKNSSGKFIEAMQKVSQFTAQEMMKGSSEEEKPAQQGPNQELEGA